MLKALTVLGILTVALVLLSCDSSSGGGYGSSPPPSPAPPSGDPQWDKVAAIIDANCAGCHDGVKEPSLKPAATFKASPVVAKLKGGLMPPPPRTISDADKATLLAYLGG